MGLPSDTPISTLTASAIHQLHLVLAQQTTPKDTAAIIIEPELGEGGYIPAPKEFLEALREVCDKEGIMLIFDEVGELRCLLGEIRQVWRVYRKVHDGRSLRRC